MNLLPLRLVGGHVRRAVLSCQDDLVRLERFWEPAHLAVGRDDLTRRLEQFPDGQLVFVADNGVTCAALYTALEGNVVFFLAAVSDPAYATLQAADQLIRFALAHFGDNPLLDHAVAVSRFSGFGAWKSTRQENEGVHDYVADGAMEKDPTLRWHAARGATFLQLVPQARSHDVENQGWGVWLRYDLPRSAATRVRRVCARVCGRRESNLQDDTPLLEP